MSLISRDVTRSTHLVDIVDIQQLVIARVEEVGEAHDLSRVHLLGHVGKPRDIGEQDGDLQGREGSTATQPWWDKGAAQPWWDKGGSTAMVGQGGQYSHGGTRPPPTPPTPHTH